MRIHCVVFVAQGFRLSANMVADNHMRRKRRVTVHWNECVEALPTTYSTAQTHD